MKSILDIDFSRPALIEPRSEGERLRALRTLNLLDTASEERFDRITQLATRFFQVPVAYVALIDGDRQWFKSRKGLCFSQTSRDVSFCQYTIQFNEPFIIHDTHEHPTAQFHPMVVGDPYLRFYAGIPLRGPDEQNIGTFCLVDFQPRLFSEHDIAQLQAFAALVEREINLSQIIQAQEELIQAREALAESQKKLAAELAEAAHYVSAMIPPPLTGPEYLQTIFQPSTHLGGDGLGYRWITDDLLALYAIDVTGHGIGSALLAVTILEFLRSKEMRELDFTQPTLVLDRLNRTFRMEQHQGKFLCAWYGVYSRSKQTLTYANGGCPPALIIRYEKGVARWETTAAGDFVLGVLPEVHAMESTIPFGDGSELLLFTDGLYELHLASGERTDLPDLLRALAKDVTEGFTPLAAAKNWLAKARANNSVTDDVSLLHFTTQPV